MGMIGFFANVANTFLNHYRQLADTIQYRPTRRFDLPGQTTTPEQAPKADRYEPSTTVTDPESKATADQPKDTVQLSGQQPSEADTTKTSTAPAESSDDDTAPAGDNDADDQGTAPAVNPDGTYYLRRSARLDYSLNLEFNLAAVQRTVQSLAEGDTQTIEQLAAAGFGLSAAFDLKGMQSVETRVDGATGKAKGAVHSRAMNALRARQASAFAANSRDFAMQGFQRESTQLMRSYDQIDRAGYRRAVNRFAVRYRMDSQFSFGFLQRFTAQTGQVAEQMPDAVNRYVDTAGKVAEMGSSDMMAAFFDGVDGYLNNAEQALLDKAISSFEAAAKELGFSGAMVDTVKARLTDSIEGFFDRVDSAMADMRTQFAPESQPIEPPVVQPPVDSLDPKVDPSQAHDTEQMVLA